MRKKPTTSIGMNADNVKNMDQGDSDSMASAKSLSSHDSSLTTRETNHENIHNMMRIGVAESYYAF